ncbi:sulfotransferase domain-containing protein [Vibrio splendidus]
MINERYPNLYIVGAPKCGTTSIAKWLNEHGDCYLPTVKEPHYFNDDDGHQMTKSKTEYLNLYQENHRILIDASVWYLFSDSAISNIEKATNAKAKYIVCIRNPVEMVEALHAEQVLGGNEDIDDFTLAWSAQEARLVGKKLKRSTHAPRHLQYGLACKLGDQIEKMLQKVDHNRVKFVFLEDMKNEPQRVFDSICTFLCIKSIKKESFIKHNSSKTLNSRNLHKLALILISLKHNLRWLPSLGIISKIKSLNIKPGNRKPVSKNMKDNILLPYFHNDICKLERVLNKDLSHWKE